MWSFKSALCAKDCDLKACKDVSDYIKNLDECRGTAGVYRYISIGLSFIPFTGISNFYSGNDFSAVFELAEGVIALILICFCYRICCDDYLSDEDETILLACESIWNFVLAAINILRFVICEALADSLELNYEFFIMMITLAIAAIYCYCGVVSGNKRRWMVGAIINVIVIGVTEVARDVYIATYSENAGDGCPFIDL